MVPKGRSSHYVKGWVWDNALRLSRPSIYIEDTTTSTCWGSKCLQGQLFSFLLNLWVPPLLAIGTLWRSCAVSWVAVWVYGPYLARRCACGTLNGSSAARFSSQAYQTKNVTFSPVGHARLPIWLRPLTAKRANNQGENIHISNSTTPIVLILVSGDSWGIALTLWG